MKKAEDFFTEEALKEIVGSIKAAEKQTSGEIRLYIEDGSKDEPLDRAAYLFAELEMHKTKLRVILPRHCTQKIRHSWRCRDQ